MMTPVAYNESLLDNLRLHHTSSGQGYVSSKIPGLMYKYTGRFGTGYVVKRNDPRSTKYCRVSYYVEV